MKPAAERRGARVHQRLCLPPLSTPPLSTPPLGPCCCLRLLQVIAAYLLAALGGNAAPGEADIKKILSSGERCEELRESAGHLAPLLAGLPGSAGVVLPAYHDAAHAAIDLSPRGSGLPGCRTLRSQPASSRPLLPPAQSALRPTPSACRSCCLSWRARTSTRWAAAAAETMHSTSWWPGAFWLGHASSG